MRSFGSMKFEWDPKKAESNLEKHGVSFEEATTCFNDNSSIRVRSDRPPFTEVRFLLIAISYQNRLLSIAFTERAGKIRIISARRASDKERNAYEKLKN